jgi:hypothetical protein|mmetsp:Transcript_54066/g.89230  ORF Transcript_54066/g.89230 Transcript_54066/m.89230 type:complete len:98 (+) Transcript_54066:1049-1342(+)
MGNGTDSYAPKPNDVAAVTRAQCAAELQLADSRFVHHGINVSHTFNESYPHTRDWPLVFGSQVSDDIVPLCGPERVHNKKVQMLLALNLLVSEKRWD